MKCKCELCGCNIDVPENHEEYCFNCFEKMGYELEYSSISNQNWNLMVYYTRLFLMLFAVLGAVSGIILIILMVGNYAY